MCFVWISEQTAIVSLYSINWVVCIIETECVYCAVRTVSLYVLLVNLKYLTVLNNITLDNYVFNSGTETQLGLGKWAHDRVRRAELNGVFDTCMWRIVVA
jgi:hypothetical protein